MDVLAKIEQCAHTARRDFRKLFIIQATPIKPNDGSMS